MALALFFFFSLQPTTAEKCNILKICDNYGTAFDGKVLDENTLSLSCIPSDERNSSSILERRMNEFVNCSLADIKSYLHENTSVYHAEVLNLLNVSAVSENACKYDMQCFSCMMADCLVAFKCDHQDCETDILNACCGFLREIQEIKKSKTYFENNYACKHTKQMLISSSWQNLLKVEFWMYKENYSNECEFSSLFTKKVYTPATSCGDIVVSWIVGVSLTCVGFLYLAGFILNWILVFIFLCYRDISENGNTIIMNIVITNILASFLTNPLVLHLLSSFNSSGYILIYLYYTLMGLNIYSVTAFCIRVHFIIFDYNITGERNERSSSLFIAGTWVFSLSIPTILLRELCDNHFLALIVVIYFYIPFTIIAFYSLFTEVSLRKRRSEYADHVVSKIYDDVHSSGIIVLALVFSCIISYIPLTYVMKGNVCTSGEDMIVPFILLWNSSLFSPLAIYATSGALRLHLKRYLCICF